jgi:hypothetical protein
MANPIKKTLKSIKKRFFTKERIYKMIIVVSSLALLASSVLPYLFR